MSIGNGRVGPRPAMDTSGGRLDSPADGRPASTTQFFDVQGISRCVVGLPRRQTFGRALLVGPRVRAGRVTTSSRTTERWSRSRQWRSYWYPPAGRSRTSSALLSTALANPQRPCRVTTTHGSESQGPTGDQYISGAPALPTGQPNPGPPISASGLSWRYLRHAMKRARLRRHRAGARTASPATPRNT